MLTRGQALAAAAEAGRLDDRAALSRLIDECEFRISPATLKAQFKWGQLQSAISKKDKDIG